jgi:hypothetical protein
MPRGKHSSILVLAKRITRFRKDQAVLQAKIDRAVEEAKAQFQVLSGGGGLLPAPFGMATERRKPGRKKGFKLSVAAKRKLSIAAKKRWALRKSDEKK